MIKTLEDIILELNPSIRELRGFDGFDVDGKSVSYDKSAAETKYASQDYARKRQAKYNALNQFELISDDAINGTTTHKDAILAIKAEFPKP